MQHLVTLREVIASQGIPWLIEIDMELVNTRRVAFTPHVGHAQLLLHVTVCSLTSPLRQAAYTQHMCKAPLLEARGLAAVEGDQGVE